MLARSNQDCTIRHLQDAVARFVDERNWQEDHDPKNLAMSIAIEAAELMEHFQWRTTGLSGRDSVLPEEWEEIRLEAADVMIYLLSFCRTLEIDLAAAVMDKLLINAQRWPARPAPNV
ncbi:MAG: nucleotide pyrophosphohydrolase [Alicyclobacillus sp.]|nr:nucleotide pyrophosphohydrolase [Alicyclobacillus sp.]